MFNVARYLDQYIGVLEKLDETAVERMAHVLHEAWKANRTVFCCGNGGSAASASHFMMDLTKLTAPPTGRRLRAMAVNENTAAISAISNDIAYDEIFVEQLRPFLEPNDVLIGLSTSGSSRNVIKAVQYANSEGAVTLGVTGRSGLKLGALARHTLVVDSTSVQQIEDATMVVGHLLCLRVKEMVARDATEVAFREKAAAETSVRIASA